MRSVSDNGVEEIPSMERILEPMDPSWLAERQFVAQDVGRCRRWREPDLYQITSLLSSNGTARGRYRNTSSMHAFHAEFIDCKDLALHPEAPPFDAADVDLVAAIVTQGDPLVEDCGLRWW